MPPAVSNSRRVGFTSAETTYRSGNWDASTQAKAHSDRPPSQVVIHLGGARNFHDLVLSGWEGGTELRTELRTKPVATSAPKPTQPTGGHITWRMGASR